MTDYIEFNTDEIARVAQATQGSQADWDRIWDGVKTKLSRTVSEALDALTGSSLEERSAQYHQKTVQYTSQLQNQMKAVQNIGNIATDTNQQMSRVISG
jgi:hypothetical protein